MERELMALAIEVSSVGASGRQLRKPITIPRPKHTKAGGKAGGAQRPDQPRAGGGQDRSYSRAVSVLERSAKAVSR